MNANFNLPPGTISKDINVPSPIECLYCSEPATHNHEGSLYCEYHYEQKKSNEDWIEDETRTNDNTTP